MQKKYLHEHTLRELLLEGEVEDLAQELKKDKSMMSKFWDLFRTPIQEIEQTNDDLLNELFQNPFWNDIGVHADVANGQQRSMNDRLIVLKKYLDDESELLQKKYWDREGFDASDERYLKADKGKSGDGEAGKEVWNKHFIQKSTTIEHLWSMHDVPGTLTDDMIKMIQVIQTCYLSNSGSWHESAAVIGGAMGEGNTAAAQTIGWITTGIGAFGGASLMALTGFGVVAGVPIAATIASLGAVALLAKGVGGLADFQQGRQEKNARDRLEKDYELDIDYDLSDPTVQRHTTQVWENLNMLENQLLNSLIKDPYVMPAINIEGVLNRGISKQ